MLEARNLNLSVGTKDLLKDSSFRIGDTDRVGLVGLNGAGKSTLLRLINETFNVKSDTKPNAGLMKSAVTSIGYLPQEISFEGDLERTAIDYAMRANEKLFTLAERLHTMEHRLATETDHESPSYDKLIHDFTEATETFERLGGYRLQSDAEKILTGLGFIETDFLKHVKEFSGGWQMRLLIAKLLLQKPTLLMLDEPTNHLDIDSLHWLENYLLASDGGYIIVSHDRFFLDKLSTKTFEISFQRMTEYKGNYTYYETEKVARYELAAQKFENDKKRMGELQSFVDRFRYKASKARQAQSRLKMLEKIEGGLERPEDDLSQISFSFPKAPPSGKVVLTLTDVRKSYPLPDGTIKPVLKGISFEVMRGDKIAIIGSNGAGKSTLCKVLSGETEFDGSLVLGHNVTMNYYAQQQAETLDASKSILAEMLDTAPDSEARRKVRDILGCFLFTGDTVERRIGLLSGGEKSRVALARMLLTASNLLILDEPTNHLDMRSKEMLIDALEAYDGTMLLVSHDRYFLDSLATKVLEVKSGVATLHQLTFAEFEENSTRAVASEPEKKAPTEKPPVSSGTVNGKGGKSATSGTVNGKGATNGAHGQSSSAKPQQMKNPQDKKKLESIEKQIAVLEKRKVDIESAMSAPEFYHDAAKSKSVSADYKRVATELETLYAEWEQAGA